MNVFVKPNEQCRAGTNIGVGENALFERREKYD